MDVCEIKPDPYWEDEFVIVDNLGNHVHGLSRGQAEAIKNMISVNIEMTANKAREAA